MKNTFLSISFLLICLGSFAQTPVWVHTDTLGGIYSAENINMDVNGYLYVGGPARDSLDKVNPAQTSASLVFKLDGAGHYYWNNGFIDNFEVTYYGMAGDNAGNTYFNGEYYTDGIQFFNGFLTRIDSSGNLVWTKHYDYEDYYDAFNNASVDQNGNILVAATSSDSFGNQDLINFMFSPADSTPLWGNRYLLDPTIYNNAFAVTDNAGGMYGVGEGEYLTFNGLNSIVLFRYSSIGSEQWVQYINSTPNSDEEPAAAISDAAGNIYIASNSSPNIDNYVANPDDYGVVPYAVKVSNSGSIVWQNLFSDTANTYNLTTSALDANYYYMAGQRNDSIYLVQLSASTGATLWSFQYLAGYIHKIALKNGAIYVTGVVGDTVGSSFFTAKFTTTGYMQWSATYQDTLKGGDYGNDLVADSSGNIYVAGVSYEAGHVYSSATVIKYHDDSYSCTLAIDSVVATTVANSNDDNAIAYAVISGGTGPYTFSWSTHATGDTITGLGLGNYCVTVADHNGCVDAACAQVVVSTCQLQVSDASVKYISSCFPNVNGSINITVSNAIGTPTYSVDSGATFQSSSSIGNLAPGSYYVYVKDAGNCISAYAGNPVTISEIADTPKLVITGDTLSTSIAYSQYLWYRKGTFLVKAPYLLTDSTCGDIYVQVTDSNGCVYVSSSIDAVCTGVNSLSEPALTFNVYPNPFGERFNVRIDGAPTKEVEIALFDLYGQQLYVDRPSANTFSIPTAGLAQGMYLLRLQMGEQYLYKQVIKTGE